MRDPALDLSFHDHRIDQSAAVVHDDVAQELHVAGADVHFDLDRMARIAVGDVRRHVVHGGFKRRIQAAWFVVALHAGQCLGDVAQRDGQTRGALDAHLAGFELEILAGCLEHVACDLQHPLAHRDGGGVHRIARRHRLPAAVAADAVRYSRGVRGHHHDVFGSDAELLRADLRERRLRALAHGHGAGVDHHPARSGRPGPARSRTARVR